VLRLEKDEEKDVLKARIVLPNNGNGHDAGPLTPVWSDPKTGVELCEGPMEYILRKPAAAPGAEAEMLFRMGRVICKREIPREQAVKLIAEGRTDAIPDFISKRGRKFTAILVRAGTKITWEFPPREKRERKGGAGAAKRHAAKEVDLSAATLVGTSAVHDGGEILETPEAYFVRAPAGAGGRVVFRMGRTICHFEIPHDEVVALLTDGRTGLIEDFVSKRGSKFGAYLVLSPDKKKANFEFPPR
jgi:DNA topoisomerase III